MRAIVFARVSKTLVGETIGTGRVAVDSVSRRDGSGWVDRRAIIDVEAAACIPIHVDRAPLALSSKVKGFVNPPEEWFQLWMVEPEG
jgi:hypothetical protein